MSFPYKPGSLIVKIAYQILLKEDSTYAYEIEINSDTCLQESSRSRQAPDWAELGFQQCPNCTLKVSEVKHCPVALNLANVVEDCEDLISHSHVQLTVTMPQRSVIATTTAQKALSSLIGLIMATSDCPHTRFFRPMAQFHVPLANQEEAIFRAISSYFVMQYFSNQSHEKEVDFSELIRIYEDMQIVNQYLAKRIQPHSRGDAPANAVVSLHLLSCILPLSLDESLEKLRKMFNPSLNVTDNSP